MAFKWQIWQNIAAGLVGKTSRSRKIRRRISDLIGTKHEWYVQQGMAPLVLCPYDCDTVAFYLSKIASSNSHKSEFQNFPVFLFHNIKSCLNQKLLIFSKENGTCFNRKTTV